MEHPVFSLSTKPDTRARRYENGANFVEITPSTKGLATVHDRDILIFCISQIMEALNDNKPVSKTVRFKAHDLLKATNRQTNGNGYKLLKDAFERLRGTTISTNIITGGEEQLDIFGLIDRARIVRETRDGRMQDVEISLSDWVFNAIRAEEVLTISRDYFRLRKPLERRLYEIGRKHCGGKAEWRIGLEKLQLKCGSNSTPREFRRLVKGIVQTDQAHGHMPDYALTMEGDIVVFWSRGTVPTKADEPTSDIQIPPWAEEKARLIARELGWDYYVLEQEWRALARRKEPPKNPGAAFVGFCKKKPSLR